MASRVLRPVLRTATRAPVVTRSFQTSAVMRADAVIVPVRKPVGAFRGGLVNSIFHERGGRGGLMSAGVAILRQQ
jgi:hypothetical protein